MRKVRKLQGSWISVKINMIYFFSTLLTTLYCIFVLGFKSNLKTFMWVTIKAHVLWFGRPEF